MFLRLSLFLLILFAGCQRATRFPAAAEVKPKEKIESKANWGWYIPSQPPRDLPIRFVSSDQPRWETLSTYWNDFPPPAAGLRTIHLGQSPLASLTAFAALGDAEYVAIKVPRGLPDPTPFIPAANPPSFGKWKLGKRIFFDKVLLSGRDSMACADCHRPSHGFTEPSATALESTRNTLSLINVVYNREQFWDGRARDLEEIFFPSADEETEAPSRTKALQSHRFTGLTQRLNADESYRFEFRLVFGVERVTHDAVAKALATYLRTILAGDSLYDKAAAIGKSPRPKAEDYAKALDDATQKRLAFVLDNKDISKTSLADSIVEWQSLFFGKAGCAACHPAPLFTNREYANIQVDDSRRLQLQMVSGRETGRFGALPIGLKDPAMRGAYRVPTLRNLSMTSPYFHTGGRGSIDSAVGHFAIHLDPTNPMLAAPLRELLAKASPLVEGGQPTLMSPGEATDIVLFLMTLDGQPVDRSVTSK